MLIIPAIDLLDGKAVRLFKGDYNKVTLYHEDPVQLARDFEKAGAKRVHIVDLDAARGSRTNRELIRKIRQATGFLIEVGGGIRSEDDVSELLDAGVERLILGTVLAKEPETIASWVSDFGKIFIAGIDALGGMVKVSGWQEGAEISDLELAARAAELGTVSIIYTNIAKDGTLSGPDVERSLSVAAASGLPVIVSGGVSSEGDIARIAALKDQRIAGVIAGKALYEGMIRLERVIQEYQTGAAGDRIWQIRKR